MKLDQLVHQNPRELVITGPAGKEQIDKDNGEMSDLVFKMSSLNFLEVSSVGLSLLSPSIDKLTHLTSLVLKGNKLTSLPGNIGKLTKLKLFDVSWNELTSLPNEISNFSDLQSLIVTGNKLTALPENMDNLSMLLVVKIDQNLFEEFPMSILNQENAKVHLTEVHAFKNALTCIPPEINRLTGLRLLDLRDNKLLSIPAEVGDCTKIKDILLTGNKFVDRKLIRIAENNKNKQILDYIRANCPRGASKTGELSSRPGRETSRDRRLKVKDARLRRRSTSRSSRENSECLMDTIDIKTVKDDDEYFIVTATPAALEQRKIVGSLVRNVDLSDERVMKRFLQIQSGLHDGICGKRSLATIAVHDFDKLKGGNKVTFDVKPPTKIRLLPLNRSKEMNATELYKALMEEAEQLRKEKKRNTFSGIHKYLYLLKGKSRFCCLTDAEGTVISFPPITNSENTKVCVAGPDVILCDMNQVCYSEDPEFGGNLAINLSSLLVF